MKILRAFVVAASLMFASGTRCGDKPIVPAYKGNELLRDCTDEKTMAAQGFCLGFISGTWAGAILVGDVYHPDKPNFIIPADEPGERCRYQVFE